MKSLHRWLVLSLLTIMTLTGCESVPKPVRNLGKSDIDFVTDIHARQQKALLEKLTRKLYVRNPRELAKANGKTVEARMLEIFGEPGKLELPPLIFDELDGKSGVDAILLSFEEEYQGDRVFAAIAGLTEMLRRSYNYQQEFFMLDSLDEQALYNSARNIEIFVWRLYHRRNEQGELLILTNEFREDGYDISFDRIFAKMTQVQDNMALIVSDKTDRGITKVVQGVAQMAFLPVP
ncbi:hypothetical protein [Vibrio sonorensis]|uniref:hypothetical protein n=1 Tax=Vibrio sonorensis TaxID=1004316 RepID=UPI0008DB08D2|nr:hypothetical protein [Vibrio sonorensis]